MFVQMIEFTCHDRRALEKLDDEWSSDAMGEGTVQRAVLGSRSEAGDRYVWIVYFESAEEARRNSERPETGGYAHRLEAMCSEGPTFIDLDIVADWPS